MCIVWAVCLEWRVYWKKYGMQIKDRLSGCVKHGTNPGPKSYLTKEEEDELAALLIETSSMGFGKGKCLPL